MTEPLRQIGEICFAYSLSRMAELKESKRLVAHYTTAEAGLKILNSKRIWLRNSALMNDFLEVEHGHRCMRYALVEGRLADRIASILEPIYPELWNELLARLKHQREYSDQHVYLTALAEIERDDELGKLSMWRAYGGNAGIALVFNPDAFETESNLGFYNSPVLYADAAKFTVELSTVIEQLEGAKDALVAIGRDAASQMIGNALQFAILSTKHEGFAEECEWRIIYPMIDTPSQWVECRSVTIRGNPQIVCEIPLENQPGMNMPEMELKRLLAKVIIGPCAFPQQARLAYAKALTDLQFEDPHSLIRVSDIPLRQ